MGCRIIHIFKQIVGPSYIDIERRVALVSSWLSGRILDWRFSRSGFDPRFGNLSCLATLKSCDTTKQSVCGDNIYIYIYIWCILKWVGPRRDFYFFLEFIKPFCSYIRVCFQLVTFVREHVWHKALLMEYSMRLEFARVCSLVFSWLWFIWMSLLLILECVHLSLLYPSFAFDTFFHCVCVCVCVWLSSFGFHSQLFLLCVCECVFWDFCVCVW